MGEELRHTVDSCRIELEGDQIGGTASVGIAFLDGQTASARDAMRQADDAMDDAKAAGRDRVTARRAGSEVAVDARRVGRRVDSDDTAPAIRVLHCDDSEPYRRLVREMMVAQPGIEIVAEAGTAALALDLAARDLPDVILLDASLEGPQGGLLSALRRVAPGAWIIALSGLERGATALGDQADCFVRKAGSFDELAAAVREGARETSRPAG